MILKIGDRVKYMDEVGGGRITKIIDKKTVLLLSEDGFEVPVLETELLKIEDEFFPSKDNISEVELEQEDETVEEEETNELDFSTQAEEGSAYMKDTDEINIYLAFVPLNESIESKSQIDIYLINDSNWNIVYNLQQKNGQKYISNLGQLESNIKNHLQTITINDLSKFKEINAQILFFKHQEHENKDPYNKKINIKPEKFYNRKSYKTNDFFEEKAIIYPLIEEDLMKEAIEKLSKSEISTVIQSKQKSYHINTPNKFTKQAINQIKEVDLHIHELIDDESGLEPKDKLDLQIKTFNEELNKAIKSQKIRKIVFIHGRGEGVLKTEILRELQRKYKHLKYQDASFKEYGYGATLIYV